MMMNFHNIIQFLRLPYFTLMFIFVVAASLPGFSELYRNSGRWLVLKDVLYPDSKIENGSKIFDVRSVSRASVGSHVPITIRLTGSNYADKIENFTFIADNNPAPVSAIVSFSKGLKKMTSFSTVIRIEEYTPIRVIAQTKTGKLLMNAVYVKSSGGCSGSIPKTDNLQYGVSKLTMRRSQQNKNLIAKFQISHPNFSGLQFDQILRLYIPVNFIKKYEVNIDGQKYFSFESSIAVSTDPYFEISFPDENFDSVELKMKDSQDKNYQNSWDRKVLVKNRPFKF